MAELPVGRAFDVRRPFTRAQALANGITDRMLEGPAFRSLFRGVYISADVDLTPAVVAAAAVMLFPPGACVSHATAARLHELPVPVLPGEHVTVPREEDRRRRGGIRCHIRAGVPVRWVAGVPVVAPEQVFVDLASVLPLVDLVVVGDHLVRWGLVSLAGLRAFCASATGRGAAPARAAVTYVRERVDSPMESRLRMLIVLAGLPEPKVNLTFGDEHGLQLRRYDLCWPEARLVVEYDGRQHIERESHWESDLERREKIEDDQWRILIVTAKGVYRTPEATLVKIHRLLLQRRMPRTPKRLSDRWRSHFLARG